MLKLSQKLLRWKVVVDEMVVLVDVVLDDDVVVKVE